MGSPKGCFRGVHGLPSLCFKGRTRLYGFVQFRAVLEGFGRFWIVFWEPWGPQRGVFEGFSAFRGPKGSKKDDLEDSRGSLLR